VSRRHEIATCGGGFAFQPIAVGGLMPRPPCRRELARPWAQARAAEGVWLVPHNAESSLNLVTHPIRGLAFARHPSRESVSHFTSGLIEMRLDDDEFPPQRPSPPGDSGGELGQEERIRSKLRS